MSRTSGISHRRVCVWCKKGLWPWHCRQKLHRGCFPKWRRRYFRNYQRQVRKELKRGWKEIGGDEAQGLKAGVKR